MKKAQWKQDPRERAFGKDQREVLNDQLTAALKQANDAIASQKCRIDSLRDALQAKQDRIGELYKFREAYVQLRAKGVVLEHNEEFKHLQNEDMDEFFGIDLGPETARRSFDTAALGRQPTGLLMPRHMQSAALKIIQQEFEKAYQDYQWRPLKHL